MYFSDISWTLEDVYKIPSGSNEGKKSMKKGVISVPSFWVDPVCKQSKDMTCFCFYVLWYHLQGP